MDPIYNGAMNRPPGRRTATVVVNLVVGEKDRRCRWIFPLTYFGLLLAITAVTFVFF
jgi:hypothetical protein